MHLTQDQIKVIYYDLKNEKKISLEKLNELYAMNTKDLVYFSIFIESRRGPDYEEEGLISTEEYDRVLKEFEKGSAVRKSEVFGKYADGEFKKEDFKFSTNTKDIEDCIMKYGRYYNDDYFEDMC